MALAAIVSRRRYPYGDKTIMDLIAKPFEITRKIQLLRIIERLDLPPESELCTLLAIREVNEQADRGAGVSEIAALLNVAVPTVSRCLQKLSAKGYISKTLNEKDRRGTYVTLTQEGQAICRRSYESLTDFIQKAFSHLDPEELEQFFQTFDKVYDALVSELEQRS